MIREHGQSKTLEEEIMKVIKISDVKAEESKHKIFIGKVYIQPLVDKKMANELQLSLVTFSPGARNAWHTHTYEQILYVTEGKGIIATEDEKVLVTPGMIIFIPPGEKHYHGATEETTFSHIYIATYGETKF